MSGYRGYGKLVVWATGSAAIGGILLSIGVQVLAQSIGFSFSLPTGYFRSTLDNETEIVDTSPGGDPPKHRLGALNGNGFGAISFNRVLPNGTHTEAALLYCKQDDRYPPHIVVGYCELFLKDSGEGDAAMKRKISFYHDRIQVWAPLVFPDGSSVGGGGVASFMRSPSAQYEAEMQDDGVVVVYDEANGHVPVSALRPGDGLK